MKNPWHFVRSNWKRFPLFGALCLSFSSCGYHLADREGEQQKIFQKEAVALSIPYFENDADGLLTEAVIRSCAASPSFRYTSSEKTAQWSLLGTLKKNHFEEIGFAYEQKRDLKNEILIPTEGRSEVEVSISIIDNTSGKTICGPFLVSGEADFDFINPDAPNDPIFDLKDTIVFSLGQLDSQFGATAEGRKRAYERVGKNIFFGLERIFPDKLREKESTYSQILDS